MQLPFSYLLLSHSTLWRHRKQRKVRLSILSIMRAISCESIKMERAYIKHSCVAKLVDCLCSFCPRTFVHTAPSIWNSHLLLPTHPFFPFE